MRASDDDEQRAEQHVHAEALDTSARAADQRTDEEARGQPRGGDPEDAELHVPGARDAVGQNLRELDAVEAVAFDAVVRGDDAHQDLHQDQRGDDPEVLQRGALRRSGMPVAKRIGGRKNESGLGFCFRAAYHQTMAQMPASSMMMLTPVQMNAFAGWAVADQGFVRPVVGVGDGVAGPVGRGGPRGPEDEAGELAHAFGGLDATGRDGVGRFRHS